MFVNGANNNTFFTFKRKPNKESYAVQVEPENIEWIVKLHQRPGCSDFLHDAVDGVANEMLVVIAQGRSQSWSGQTFDAFQMLSSKCPKKDGHVDKPWTAKDGYPPGTYQEIIKAQGVKQYG
ncbi:hypothetical protein IWW34DRAFT_791804 [Fusarium oxysporum f. sp. albedinis]|nr:hypothetical protein IWW34DRAFT_791804 [Fusarium oxysporum f. sp. albedinis]